MARRGHTLLDLTLTVVVIGLLAAIAMPRLAGYREGLALRLARGDLVTALDAARGSAIRLGARVAIGPRPGALEVWLVGGDSTPVWRGPHPDSRGVAVSGFDRPVLFGPDGLATAVANRTLRLTIGHRTRQLVLSRLGRIRW